jgi:hypothetical protein
MIAARVRYLFQGRFTVVALTDKPRHYLYDFFLAQNLNENLIIGIEAVEKIQNFWISLKINISTSLLMKLLTIFKFAGRRPEARDEPSQVCARSL